MGKDKLKKFAENRTFRCLVQPEFEEIFRKDHPLKGRWNAEFFHNDHPIVLELGCGKGEYTVALAAQYGVTAIVQPGGSIRDEEVFEAARKAGVTMYVTGTRHFFH